MLRFSFYLAVALISNGFTLNGYAQTPEPSQEPAPQNPQQIQIPYGRYNPDKVNDAIEPHPEAHLPAEVLQIGQPGQGARPTLPGEDGADSFLWNWVGLDFSGWKAANVDGVEVKKWFRIQLFGPRPQRPEALIVFQPRLLGIFIIVVFLGAWLLSFRRRWFKGYYPTTSHMR
jgi:hypothetical protein